MSPLPILLATSVLALGSSLALRIGVVDPAMENRSASISAAEELRSPGPAVLSLAAMEHALAWADLFWLGMVQEFGRPIDGHAPRYDRLERWAHIASDLDPRYFVVYYGSAIHLMVYGRRPRSAEAIAEKGRPALPERWQFPFLLGYAAYFYDGDPKTAANHWFEASRLPRVPRFLPSLAGRARWQAGDQKEAIALLEGMLEHLEGPHREDAEIRLKVLRSDRILREYDGACGRFRKARGRLPADGAELFAAGLTTAPPFDLLGAAITLDESCRARTAYVKVREDEALGSIGSEARGDAQPPEEIVNVRD